MAANMWKNSLKNTESNNNNILYGTLVDFFLQRNGIYFLNKPRIYFGTQIVINPTGIFVAVYVIKEVN